MPDAPPGKIAKTRPSTAIAQTARAGTIAAVLSIAAAGLILFPFDWLEEVWPAYGAVFDVVFASAASHLVGHATIFFLAGLLILLALPALRPRPWVYLGVMALGALAEESIQAIFKLHLPNFGDGRDLLMDALGFIAAYLLVRGWLLLRRPGRAAR